LKIDQRRAIIVFLIAAAVQAIGFPLISKIFGLGDRFQSPSWVVVILVSLLFVAIDQMAFRKKSL
jgi:ABC-type multidrug transport system permease subunit